MQIPRRTLPEWKRVRRGISFRSVQCLNGGHRNAVLLFYLGKLLCRAFQLAGTQRLGERHRRGIQVGKAQILFTSLPDDSFILSDKSGFVNRFFAFFQLLFSSAKNRRSLAEILRFGCAVLLTIHGAGCLPLLNVPDVSGAHSP